MPDEREITISKRFVDALPTPADRDIPYYDKKLTGFRVLTRKSGTHSYQFRYRTPQGKQDTLTIAKVGDITPEQARNIAEAASQKVKAGGDPKADKAEAKAAFTMDQLFDAYLESEKFAEKAPKTKPLDRSRIDRHLRAHLGKLLVKKVTLEDGRRAFRQILAVKAVENEKPTARGRRTIKIGGPNAARDSMVLCKSILNWAVEQQFMAANPLKELKIPGSRQKEAHLEDAETYGRLFETLTVMENEKRIRRPAADAIRVISLTGARPGEIEELRARHIRLKSGEIVIPAAEHKGRRTGRDRIIKLPTVAQEIIARNIKEDAQPDDWVFAPGKGAGGSITLKSSWRKVRVEAELPDGIGLHGLRHSVATLMALDGAGAAEIMGAMGHANLKTSSRYIHFADRARKTLADKAAAPAIAGMAIAAGKTAADVVPATGKGRKSE